MANPTWDKGVVQELIKAGYRALTRRYHPDAGGSHEQMLVLKASFEYLDNIFKGPGGPSFGQEREKPRGDGPFREKPREEYGEIKLKQYAAKWYYCDDVLVARETERAILVKFPTNAMPQWCPKSQLHATANEVWEEGDRGKIVMSDWIARQKGWL